MLVERFNRNFSLAFSSTHSRRILKKLLKTHNFGLSLPETNKVRNCTLVKSTRTIGSKQSVNMKLNKYFLIYYLILSINIQCTVSMRRQDYSIESPLPQTTPSTNSIDLRELSDDTSDTNSEEYSEEVDEAVQYAANAEVRQRYEMQHNIFNKNVQEKIEKAGDQVTTTTPKILNENTCSNACLARKDVEAANTESIRKHILMKLGMDENKLNHTNYPKLNKKLIEKFCQSHKISPEICFGRKQEFLEYQSDDPTVTFNDDDYFQDHKVSRENDENVQFLSYENRIYAFTSSECDFFYYNIIFFATTFTCTLAILSIELPLYLL